MWPNGFNIPGVCDTQVFYATQSTGINFSWQTWNKPSGISMVCINLIAAGGGGGHPTNSTTGCGGGGSGGMSCLIIPAIFLPNTLHLRVGAGGPGGQGSSLGAGQPTYISAEPIVDSTYFVLSQDGGQGASGGSTTGGGTAGAVASTSSGIFQGLGVFYSIAGRPGFPGATTSNTSAAAMTVGSNGVPLTGGTGGGSGTGAGGAITVNSPWPAIAGGVGTTGGAGNHGLRSGFQFGRLLGSNQPLVFSGGTGGGGGTSPSVGGDGGDGAYGCGGGGGGTGTGGLGQGGRGGDGVVIITSW